MTDIFGEEPMRALSWKQPYASLMLPPFNKIETRTWNTSYRGLVLICASKAPYTRKQIISLSGAEQEARIFQKLAADPFEAVKNYKQSLGRAIAVGRLVDVRRMLPEDVDQCFIEYAPQRYCHIYEDIRPIKPFYFIGRQGWGKVLAEERARIHYLVAEKQS